MLAGGIVVGYHGFVSDCSLLIPAALLVLARKPPGWLGWVAVAPLVPLIYFTGWWRELLVASMFLFVAGVAFETWRGTSQVIAGSEAR
jgi:hypothetical protein